MYAHYSSRTKKGRPKKNVCTNTDSIKKPVLNYLKNKKCLLEYLENSNKINHIETCNIKHYRYYCRVYYHMLDSPALAQCSYKHIATIKSHFIANNMNQKREQFYEDIYKKYMIINKNFNNKTINFIENIIINKAGDLESYKTLNNREKTFFIDLLKKISKVMQDDCSL